MPSQGPPDDHDYLAREARARLVIDKQLAVAGWSVQSQESLNLSAGPGVAVREFTLEKPHGRVDYLLFLNGQPAGVIEAKPEGTTLTEVEHQSGKYVAGLPDWMTPPVYPLPFIYESTGAETRFTNGYDPDARSRRVFTFHRPETQSPKPGQRSRPGSSPGIATARRGRSGGMPSMNRSITPPRSSTAPSSPRTRSARSSRRSRTSCSPSCSPVAGPCPRR